MSKAVDIRQLKTFALNKLGGYPALRDLILGEHDQLEANEFLSKADLWLKLLQRGA